MPTSGNQVDVSSTTTYEPAAFLTTLDSAPADLATIINDDIQADLYDPLCSFGFTAMALSPDLSNALALIATSPTSKRLNTVLDSGSTHHIFRDRSAFRTYDTAKELSVTTANCGSLVAMGMGTVTMAIHLAGRTVELTLQNCLHAPDVPVNLFSVGELQENGFRIHFEPGTNSPYTHIIFPTAHATLPNFSLKAEFIHWLSFISCDFGPAVSMSAVAPGNDRFPKISPTPSLWHRRLCHPHIDVTRAVLTKNYVSGVKFSGTFERDKCMPCLIGKSPQQPYSHHGHRASRVGELLHMDTCGPFPVATPSGKKYFNTVLDDCSNFGFTTLVAHKSEAVDFYLGTEAHIERISDQRVLSIHIDNAPEFVARRLGSHFKEHGIMVQAVAPYAHAQNGKVERYIRTLEDGLQTLLADSGLPTSFWGDAVLTVQYLRNRLPTSALPADTTPFEAFYKKKPDISHLRVWGCQCFAIIAPELRSKGGPRRLECIFVGYDEHRVGWRLRDLKGGYHFSRDVIFNESLNARLGSPQSSLTPSTPAQQRVKSITGKDYSSVLQLVSDRHVTRRQLAHQVDEAGGDTQPRRSSRILARSTLAVDPAILLADFVSFVTLSSIVFSAPPIISLSSQELCILEEFLVNPSIALMTTTSNRNWDLTKPPSSYADACARPDAAAWRAAMDREISSLHDMGAFLECDLPAGKKPLTLKWVYDHKIDSDGQIIAGKEKARIVARGFRQRPEDFGETAAPVAKLSSIRLILAWAALKDLEIFQFDCKTAFLHAKLRHDVYSHSFPGWPISRPGRVLKIIAALYGLRQSAYEFYMLFFSLLSGLGMVRCDVDHGVFFGEWVESPDPSVLMPSDGSPLTLIIPIHVDDSLGITNSTQLYLWFLRTLGENLHIVDLGACSKFLSILIIRDRAKRQLSLSSHLYVGELLAEWNMAQCKTAPTPLPVLPPKTLLKDNQPDDDIKPKYQRLVGCLLYLSITTRPDIAFAAMWLGQYASKPTRSHFLLAKHVLRYLAGSASLVLSLGSLPLLSSKLRGHLRVLGCADADWASDSMDRRSISGYCFFFNGSLISWSSTKQRAIALSSTEAEYYALTHALKEAIWMRIFCSLLKFPFTTPFPLFSDNQAALSLSTSESVSARSKHIDIKHHFIRSHIKDGSFSVNWIETSEMPADIFTKPLLPFLFNKHRQSLGLTLLPSLS